MLGSMVTLTADEDESKADRGSRADESSSESESEESKKARGISASPQDAELEAAIAAIRATKDLPRPPYPNLPNLNGPGSMQAKVNSVQTYIEKLQYNFTGVNYFDIRKNRPMTCATHTHRARTPDQQTPDRSGLAPHACGSRRGQAHPRDRARDHEAGAAHQVRRGRLPRDLPHAGIVWP